MSCSSSSSEKTMIVLKSSDGETFEVEEKAARLSKTLENMIEENCADTVIPLPTIDAGTLRKVIEFCNKHAEPSSYEDSERLSTWDAEFVNVDCPVLFDLLLAANFLEIPRLLNLSTDKVADMIRGKTPEEIRKFFNIQSDHTLEDEDEYLGENQPAFV